MNFNYPPALNHKPVTWFVGPGPPGNQNLVSNTPELSNNGLNNNSLI